MATPLDSRDCAATTENNEDEARDVQLGLSQLTETFTSLAPADRDLFLQLSRQFQAEPSLRKHVKISLQPHDMTLSERARSTFPFRFMDLPVELRLYIAEYALTADDPLDWEWSTYETTLNAKNRVGTFMGIPGLTALSRVSRQLHSEVASIVWKANNFSFTEDRVLDYKEKFTQTSPEWSEVEEAYEFFLRRAGAQTLQDLRSVVITIDLTNWADNHRQLMCRLDMLTRIMPHVRHKILACGWVLIDALDADLRDMVWEGQSTLHELKAAGFESALERNWKIFPDLDADERKWLEEQVNNEDAKLALHWADNGI